ncbi:MAG: ribosome maturation factor RimP [Bacillota bacterium]
MAPKDRIEDIVERLGQPVAEKLGYELVAVEYRKEGPDWVLRCFIDSPAGIGVDECQRFSEALGTVLDKEDPIPGSYLLEVSSPGIERPLRKDADFVRFAGENVELRLNKPINGQKVYQGELLGLVAGGPEKLIRIKQKETIIEIPRTEVAKVHIMAELFGSKGGKKKK